MFIFGRRRFIRQEEDPASAPPAGASVVPDPAPAPAPEPTAAVVADLLQRYLASQVATQPPAPEVVEPEAKAPEEADETSLALASVLYDLEVLKADVPAAAKPYLPKDVDSLRVFLASPEYTTLVTALTPAPVAPVPAVPVPPSSDNAEGAGSGPRTPNFAAIGRRMS